MNDPTQSQAVPAPEDDDSISLLDLLLVLAAGRKTIFKVTSRFAVGSVVVSLLMSNVYTGKTSFIPPNSNQLTAQSAVAAQVGAILGGGGGLAAALKNPADLWVALLKSESVETFVIRQNNLMEVFKSKNMALAIKTLEGASKINADKAGLVTIEVDNKDPELAAKIANGYVTGLMELNKRLVFSQAGQKRLFFEQQLQLARDGLAKAEIIVAEKLQAQGATPEEIRKKLKNTPRAADETVGQLRGRIAAKEIQISAMKSYAADQNLELIQAQQELAALQDKLSAVEGVEVNNGQQNNVVVESVQTETPQQAQLAIQKAIQDIRYYDSYIQILMDQYEQARLDESKEPVVLQIVDVATPPELKSKPKRALIVIISTLAGFFLSILWVFLKNALNKAEGDPETAGKIAQLRKDLPIEAWWQSTVTPKLAPWIAKTRPLVARWESLKKKVWPFKK